MSNKQTILACVRCRSLHLYVFNGGMFFCLNCRLLANEAIRLKIEYCVNPAMAAEGRDWDAAMSELWRAEGHTVGGAT